MIHGDVWRKLFIVILEQKELLMSQQPLLKSHTRSRVLHHTVYPRSCRKSYKHDCTDGDVQVQNVTYTYDTLNRLSTVTEDGALKATYTYDTNGTGPA